MTSTTSAEPGVKPWRLGLLAGMASALDAGTIVAVAYAIEIWESVYGLSPLEVGAISAALTICIGIGSVIGGRLGDRVGRKRIYTYDLLVFGAGVLVLVFAANTPMLFAGVVIAGLAMGADIPTSLALVGEMSPADKRGRILSFGWLMWVAGILLVTILVAVFGGLVGDRLPQLLFGALFAAGIVTWLLRAGIRESRIWLAAVRADADDTTSAAGSRRSLWTPAVIRGLAFTASFYLFLTLGTNFLGAFNAYMLVTIAGLATQTVAMFGLLAIAIATICILITMRLIDTRARRPLFYLGASLMVLAWVLPIATSGEVWALVAGLLIYNVGSMFAGEMHWRVWAQELTPTLLRGATQGISFGIARAASGGFLLVAPLLLEYDFRIVFWIMLGLSTASGLIGAIWMPRTQNRPVEEIDRDYAVSSVTADDRVRAGTTSETAALPHRSRT